MKIDKTMKWRAVIHVQDLKKSRGSQITATLATDFTEPLIQLIQSKKKTGKTNKIHFLLFGQIKNPLACCLPLKLRLVEVLSQLLRRHEENGLLYVSQTVRAN